MGIEPTPSAWKAEILNHHTHGANTRHIEVCLASNQWRQYKLLYVPIVMARLGVEPSPFASEAAVLETARAAAHLRAAKAEVIQP